MPHANVIGNCPHCQKQVTQQVYYTVPEEISAKTNKYMARGFFIFGLTALLFVWGLVLMLKEYDMKKLGKLLDHPGVQLEDTWYSNGSKEINADTVKITKFPQGSPVGSMALDKHLADVNVRLQGELDKAQARVRELEAQLSKKEAPKKEK